MQKYPHHYSASAFSDTDGSVNLTSPGLTAITSAPPAEFDGPGDKWSPETLLVAAVADCFILTFKAIARASKLDWSSLRCDVAGTLDHVDRVSRFTGFRLAVALTIPNAADEQKAMLLIEKSDKACLVSNSLNADMHLSAVIDFSEAASLARG